MTAEIAVMNRVAIALAADSAATSYSGLVAKIYNTAEKLFQLDQEEPIAAMIYGGSSFMGLPWEVLIKQYRKERSCARSTVSEYGEDFLNFLTSCSWMTDEAIDQHFEAMARDLIRDLSQAAEDRRQSERIHLDEATAKVLDDCVGTWSDLEFAGSMTAETEGQLSEKYADLLEEIAQEATQGTPRPGEKDRVKRLIILFATRSIEHDERSGIVVAGFGTAQFFPALVAWEVECIIYPRHLRAKQTKKDEISRDAGASIVPFAQAEMVHSFMTGIDPKLRGEIFDSFGSLLDRFLDQTGKLTSTHLQPDVMGSVASELGRTVDALKDEFKKSLLEFCRKGYVFPVLDAVELLPKDQLAVMAETLVALTSFKRKMSRDVETVGGEIDVAVITKGDGLIWTKRKHYFDPILNPRYFKRINSPNR